jgi:hypothetical protein
MPYSLWISAFLEPLKSHFKNAAAAWMKQNPQRKITRYRMTRLIEFAWNKAASIGVDVNAFESTGIYPSIRNRVPEYFFSISDTSKTNFHGNSISIYGSDLCTLYVKNQLCVTYLSRTFVTYSEYYIAF